MNEKSYLAFEVSQSVVGPIHATAIAFGLATGMNTQRIYVNRLFEMLSRMQARSTRKLQLIGCELVNLLYLAVQPISYPNFRPSVYGVADQTISPRGQLTLYEEARRYEPVLNGAIARRLTYLVRQLLDPLTRGHEPLLRTTIIQELVEWPYKAGDLIRHICGNPWRPWIARGNPTKYPYIAAATGYRCMTYNQTKVWPVFYDPNFSRSVVELAISLYSGANCSFALHDALLETGQAELADHFAAEKHPRGCWALDVILGKK